MFELTIDNQVYQFRFGMGFLKEMNKRVSVPVEGVKDVNRNVGLRYTVASLIEGDMEMLEDVLDVANKGQNPRLTRAALESYLEDEDTDIDQLFEDVLDFLKKANCTRKTVMTVLEAVEKEKAQS